MNETTTTAARDLWALGDYQRISHLIRQQGAELVRWSGLGSGDRVLDVAAGTGAASRPAAAAGAEVVATDLVPELLSVGERLAETEGLRLEWRTADAQDLPFPDGGFDVVLSAIGAMFAPDHARVASEMIRVCRPGGTLAMASWTPGGAAARFFGLLQSYLPPAEGAPPTAWGDPGYVRELFADRVAGLETREASVTVDFDGSAAALLEVYRRSFPPLVAAYDLHADDPETSASLTREFLAFFTAERERGGGHVRYEYLLVRARRHVTG
jgi:SAM-dependent methyltransferase